MYSTRELIVMYKDREFVHSARVVGASKFRQAFYHCLPAVLGKIVYSQMTRISAVIFSVSSLAFLGLIQTNDTYNLGIIVSNARSDFRFNHWVLTFPVFILVTTSLSLKFVSLGLHDALEPPKLEDGRK